MQQLPFKHSVHVPKRPQVAPDWLVLLLTGLVLGTLWLIYPREDLERRLESTQDHIELTEAYLRNLLRSEPDNLHLQALLQKVEHSKMQMAAAPPPAAQIAAHNAWLAWEESYTAFQHMASEGSEAQALARAQALDLQRQLSLPELSDAQLLYLGQAALVLQSVDLARQSFEQLLQRPASQADGTAILEVAAQSALSNGLYDTAADWLVEAASHSDDVQRRKQLLLTAVSVLQASGEPARALALAEQVLEPFADDPLVLQKLVEVARAAKRPDAAQQYVKRLLQLSLREQIQPFMQFAALPGAMQQMPSPFWDDQWPPASPWIHPVAGKQKPLLPFDDKTYALGYTVFLENSNLEDARRVAKAAVQQAPEHMEWRRRLAQVSEWTQRPLEALAQWHVIAQRTNDAAAWEQVLRLAPGLLDDVALIDALEYKLRRNPHDERLVHELIAAYERMGEPQKAIALLRNHAGQSPPMRAALAELYERVGEDAQALQQWEQLFQDPRQLTYARALKASLIALRLGNGLQGLAWLQAIQVPDDSHTQEAADYLRLKAEVADRENHVTEAIASYEKLSRNDAAVDTDFDDYIDLLSHNQRISEAAAVARLAWEKHHLPRHFLQALNLHSTLQDWSAATPLVRSLASVSVEQRSQLQADPNFFVLLGNYYQGTQQPLQARKTFEEGLRQFPSASDLRQSLIWQAIDSNDTPTLQLLLKTQEHVWRQDPAMHDALAAAYQTLSLPQVALNQYLQPRLDAHRSDFLWMMGYADALEQNQQIDLAWRLRQQLLANEAPSRTSLSAWLQDAQEDAARRLARTRLVMTQYPGDTGTKALREMLRLDQQHNPQLSQSATDTLIGWYQETGQYSAVRAHLWQRYIQSRMQKRTLWAEMTTAIAQNNHAEVGQLLERHGSSLSRYDMATASMLVGDVRNAQSTSFEAQTQQSHDDTLHQQLTESLLAFSDSARLSHTSRRLNALREQDTTAEYHWALTPRWSLDIQALRIQRSSHKTSELHAPSDERGLSARLRWQSTVSSASLLLGHRESLATYHPVQLQWTQRLGNRWSWHAEMGHEMHTTETTALRMGGLKSRMGAGLTYQPTRLDALSFEHYFDRFHLQTGARIGHGQSTTLQYRHSLRSEAPSLEISGFWSQFRYRERHLAALSGRDLDVLRYLPGASGERIAPGYLLPQDFNYYGVTLATNQHFSENYTRAVRPFARLTLSRHSREGNGYDFSIGLAGSVLGQDHLMVGLGISKSSPQSTGSTRALQLSYRLHF